MRLRYSIFIVIFLFLGSCKEGAKETVTEPLEGSGTEESGAMAPLFQDLEGNAIALSDYKGKKVLLNFWATWCRPCLEEMPALLRSQELLEKENYVFLLASDQPVATIKAFKERKDYDFNYLKYSGSLTEEGVNALPTTFVYNEKGEQVDTIIGATDWDGPEMIQKLKEIH